MPPLWARRVSEANLEFERLGLPWKGGMARRGRWHSEAVTEGLTILHYYTI